MSDELLPCPFCGGEAYTVERGIYGWSIECDTPFCPCSFAAYRDKAEAIAAWNTRAERTCKYIGDDIDGCCSKCHGWLDPDCAYCPSCGAKVVEK